VTPAPDDGRRLAWRVDEHDKRLERLERFEPAVMVRQLSELDKDVSELRSQLKWQTRALIGAMLTMVGTLAVALAVLPHG
jgi:hypothetical protein